MHEHEPGKVEAQDSMDPAKTARVPAAGAVRRPARPAPAGRAAAAARAARILRCHHSPPDRMHRNVWARSYFPIITSVALITTKTASPILSAR